jgi:hypothetical protein
MPSAVGLVADVNRLRFASETEDRSDTFCFCKDSDSNLMQVGFLGQPVSKL